LSVLPNHLVASDGSSIHRAATTVAVDRIAAMAIAAAVAASGYMAALAAATAHEAD
jgi:hypothetical protein